MRSTKIYHNIISQSWIICKKIEDSWKRARNIKDQSIFNYQIWIRYKGDYKKNLNHSGYYG